MVKGFTSVQESKTLILHLSRGPPAVGRVGPREREIVRSTDTGDETPLVNDSRGEVRALPQSHEQWGPVPVRSPRAVPDSIVDRGRKRKDVVSRGKSGNVRRKGSWMS